MNIANNFLGIKYIIKEDKIPAFKNNIIDAFAEIVPNNTAVDAIQKLDKELEKIAIDEPDTEKLVKEFENIITSACRRSFRTSSRVQNLKHKKSVPWWSDELTMLRKRTNATRRRYQKTRNSEELREQRRNQYVEAKRTYERTMARAKMQSWNT